MALGAMLALVLVASPALAAGGKPIHTQVLVLDTAGKPVAGMRVVAQHVDMDQEGPCAEAKNVASQTSDAKGIARFALDGPVAYFLAGDDKGFGRGGSVGWDQDSPRLTLKLVNAHAALAVRVVDAKGRPVKGAWVSLNEVLDCDCCTSAVETDSSGRARLSLSGKRSEPIARVAAGKTGFLLAERTGILAGDGVITSIELRLEPEPKKP